MNHKSNRILISLATALALAGPVHAQTTELVSIASDGTQADNSSSDAVISGDGRHVAFISDADNLVPNDTNGAQVERFGTDVFVHDRLTGQTVRVSVASDGTEANAGSFGPAISANGRFVAFYSHADNLVEGDSNSVPDVFLHDRDITDTGMFDQPGNTATIRVSVSDAGEQGDEESRLPAISADGRHVAFSSEATNLVPNDTNRIATGPRRERTGGEDVFVHDRVTHKTVRVSVASDGAEAGSGSVPAISADGRFVAFTSSATNLVDGDTNGLADVFVHDRDPDENGTFDDTNGVTERVNVSSEEVQANAVLGGPDLAISGDGRFVAFDTVADNLVPGDSNAWGDVFVRDRQEGTTELVSWSYDGTTGHGHVGLTRNGMSADGRFVVMVSNGGFLVPNDTVGTDIFVRDRLHGVTSRVSVSATGDQADARACGDGTISADGRVIAFCSNATNLVPGDVNGGGFFDSDVFVRDLGPTDCDANGFEDLFEISGDLSLDCEANGVLDVCEIAFALTPDTDGDGVPDRCDVCPGGDDSVDTDGDGVPDGCDACPTEPAETADGCPLLPGTVVRVECITYTTDGGKGNGKNLTTTLIVVDDAGTPVAGAVVSATLRKSDGSSWTGSATTDADGNAAIRLKNARDGCYTLIVDDVTADGLQWLAEFPNNGFEKGADPTPDADCLGTADNCGEVPF